MRSVDYSSRRKSILTSAISRYIKNAAPVASEDIADEFELSSATIRNIFSEHHAFSLIPVPASLLTEVHRVRRGFDGSYYKLPGL